MLTGLPDRLRGGVAEVEATGPEAVTLHMKDGQTVVWGAAERAGEDQAAGRRAATAVDRAIRTVDISAPEVLKTK